MGNITLTFLCGCMLGSLSTSSIADGFGRKPTLLLASIFFLLGSLFQTTTASLYNFYLARTVTGLAIGMYSMVVPLYISEIAPSSHRGTLVTFNAIFLTGGIIVASGSNALLLTYSSGEMQWRLALGIPCILALMILITLTIIPESPRWLLAHGKEEESKVILSKLSALHPNSPQFISEFKALKEHLISENASTQASWGDVMKYKKRVAIAMLLQAFQQLTGINILFFYAGKLFGQLGLSDSFFNILGVLNATVNFLATLVGMYCVDRLGRRTLFVLGAAGMGIAYTFVVIFSSLTFKSAIYLALGSQCTMCLFA